MEFVTDRTSTDVMLRNDKGTYNASDLNRVCSNTKELYTLLTDMGVSVSLQPIKTNWAASNGLVIWSRLRTPNFYSMDDRYLYNVRALIQAFGVSAELPDTMDCLTYEGANQIEQAQQKLYECIEATKAAYPICGAAECGG